MLRLIFLVLSLFLVQLDSIAQDSLQTVVAEKGDGIFSILRKQGLNPSKYYAEFVALNKDNIKNGSELELGKSYKIPNAPDSFKVTGREITISDGVEEALFEDQLSKITAKTATLNQAVYYLIAEDNLSNSSYSSAIISELARELLINGAQVYLIKPDTLIDKKDKAARTQEYVENINKRYLKHIGKYQRLLIVRTSGEVKNRRLDVAVYHHNKSEEGQKFAENIKSIVEQNSAKNRSVDDYSEIFKDDSDVFLAKNVLPAISVIDIIAQVNKPEQRRISVYSDRKTFTKWIKKGMLKDYAELIIEEE